VNLAESFVLYRILMLCTHHVLNASMQSEVLDTAVKGTLNVLKICTAAKVHKLVVMSSNAAVDFNPNWPQDILKDESAGQTRSSARKMGLVIPFST
jgi:nucleoside-diphosphate-sugar epimerase